MFSSLSSSDHSPSPLNQQLLSCWSPIKPSFHSTYAIVLRYDGLTDQRYAIVLRLCLAFSSPSHHADLAITDLAIADLGFVGLCWWMWMWVGGCGFVPVVGFGMWVCLVWWMWVCPDFSGCFFFFLVDLGLCWWWLLVLLRQWLLCCCCCCWWWWWGWKRVINILF